MPRQKYDLSSLKLEFFQSEHDDVKSFLNQLGINQKINGKHTKGRADEKQKYKQKILQKALEDHVKKQAKTLDIDIEVLKKGKRNGLIQIINQLSKTDSKGNIIELPMKDLVRGINQIKVELGEPTSYNKHENLNKDISFTGIEIHHVGKDGKRSTSDKSQ